MSPSKGQDGFCCSHISVESAKNQKPYDILRYYGGGT